MLLRQLGPDDLAARHALSSLAFGGDPAAAAEPPPAGDGLGAFDERGRLVAQALVRPYDQRWCGRLVPMAGVADVAVHPDARGQGLVGRLLAELMGRARERGQLVSVLYPTAPRIYRRLGWEIVGSLHTTRLPLHALAVPPAAGTTVRTADTADGATIAELYDAVASTGSGLLARSGPSFPAGPTGALTHDVVSLAEDANGRALAYVSYSRGRGYRGGGPLRLGELISTDRAGTAALLGSLAGWDSVADHVLWRGSTDDLALHLPGSLPPPEAVQPWMLRVLDPAGAVAARGFLPGLAVAASFALEGRHGDPVGWRLEVSDGRAALEPDPARDLPLLSARGFALLYSGVATDGRLVRGGLLDRPVPGLAAAFSGPPPTLLDYF